MFTCIRQYQGAKTDSKRLYPDCDIIVRFEKPDIRRYTENEKKNTFDVVDIVIKTTLSSSKELKEWFNDKNNRQALVKYALDKISKSKEYMKYGVSTDYLTLTNVGVGKSRFRLVFALKQ